ncbi:dna-directed rna polymerases i ii and iii subunit rpabc2 [Holotrichia oblita]|uniref:Dna-directed rna polymerases i ii and iii subunit rpabc2 n=1 Tax=Holotrichia oblita TaxID=644536 RepID=A0ACB9TMJ8_HOLOL|nr:dna-directed rna polymerases i ii and iii subunit rpabc2 [Holotrichia oblita]
MAPRAVIRAAVKVFVIEIAKNLIKKQKKKKRLWVKDWIRRRNMLGASATLLKEIVSEDPESYKNFMRLSPEKFEELLKMVESKLTKSETWMRSPLSARIKLEINVAPVGDKKKARKRKSNDSEWKSAKEKRLRYSSHSLPVYPTCRHKTKAFQCASLTMLEIRAFQEKFYSEKKKLMQDNFILQFCRAETVMRYRPKNAKHNKKLFQKKFCVLSLEKTHVPVCKNAFMGILGITRRRIDTVINNFVRTSLLAKENRRGDRKTEMYSERKKSVMEFINKFKAIESHYCRGPSERLYLDSTLNIKNVENVHY